MKISVGLDAKLSPAELAANARDLEAAGADVLWVVEAYGRDAISQLGYVAASTRRVQLGSGVVNVYSRSAALLAQSAATLDELSEGRFILGLGSSGPQVIEGWHAMPFVRPQARTSDVIDACRIAWRRERLELQGAALTVPIDPSTGTGLGKALKLMSYPVRERVPIWVAALGDRNVEMTAAKAEGWLPFMFLPERARDVWGDALAAGLAKRPPELGPLQISAATYFAIADTPEAVRRERDRARPRLARSIGGAGARSANFYNRLARRAGFGRDADVAQELWLAGKPADAAAALSDELIEAATLVGSRSYVAERLAAYREAGATHLRIHSSGEQAVRDVEALRSLM